MVTRGTPYLTIDIILDVVVKKKFPLLHLGWYIFSVLIGNRYLAKGSNGNVLCVNTTGNVFVGRWVMPLVTIQFLDFVMIH